MKKTKKRRIVTIFIFTVSTCLFVFLNDDFRIIEHQSENVDHVEVISYNEDLNQLEVKGRAPKTGYSRDEFGKGWRKSDDGCDTRNKILKRDLKNTTENEKCQILTGELNDPYTGKIINFSRSENASEVQIDHVVALSDAWQKGAQQLEPEVRVEIANDPLNLLAVDGSANQQKKDSDAASWLPSNKTFRCQYIKRQISVKKKYNLWVTSAEKTAMEKVLNTCSAQTFNPINNHKVIAFN